MRILFLARSLRVGGTERQLSILARGLRRDGHAVSIAVFYGGGEFEDELRRDGVAVYDLAKSGRWDNLSVLSRLARLVRRERPDILHSYLDSPNVMAASLSRLFPSVKLVWGIRSSMQDLSAYDWMNTVGDRLGRLASPLAKLIIANSEATRRHALAAGYPQARLRVIPNGIDCDLFRFDPAARDRLRDSWGVSPDAELVGVVARLDPIKNHGNFLRAAALVAAARPRVRFVCVGGGTPAYEAVLHDLADELGLGARLTWTGPRRATRAEYSALDVAVLPSDSGEGFPNVVAEAMACSRPVAATDSGDVQEIVGDIGEVVPPRDPEALASAISRLLSRVREEGPELATRARARIQQRYSVETLVRTTAELLTGVQAGA